MRLVIADTGPVNYLIQIGQIELLPRMFEKVAVPLAVQTELFRSTCAAAGSGLDRGPSGMA